MCDICKVLQSSFPRVFWLLSNRDGRAGKNRSPLSEGLSGVFYQEMLFEDNNRYKSR